GFRMACIVTFGLDFQISPEDFKTSAANSLAERLYTEAIENYQRHKEGVKSEAVPVFQNIRQTQGTHIENVVVPFSDGRKGINVLVNLNKTVETSGEELCNAMERNITLAIIDDTWKEHLRSMDDLKQSVQTAYLEQKDPLVIYKMEAYNLFRRMSSELNREIVSFLCHSQLPVQQQEVPNLREGHQQRTDMSNLQANKDEIDTVGEDYAANEKDYYDPSSPAGNVAVRQEPIKVGPKIGRNDPCPCGSGKKFKNCHGKDA
ncbi:MAG TPA: SEC-C metal-binding domain-containing protein, partial [Flavisolibacter sp.]